ncbi:MAG: hypothetical protein HN995_06340 [Candidatus Marinimicrobia bacterium]|nr:hypothetical protein [Candidatus Neomarinimicrobiota bacterium]MBT3575920.1 hypothetical protein [Candidatus Neomarinimicrobiota bacterium]MBT3679383.1 hypothetical protein [Candidatus Neomarinimicrobiota bacterium]MBT3951148.1 hypothetical protein [Candidatus Neomarinimicrobiota bacterium]MBT4254172.1 hypothetical protein [Candidatus Neomarinimicrobiota bacterium]
MLINKTLSIARDTQTIWDFWLDVSNDTKWRGGITKAEWTSPPPHGVGSTGEHTHKDTGILKWEMTQLDDGHSFEFKHTEGALKGSIAFFQVEPEDVGSRVTVQMRLSGPIVMRIMMLFMGGMMRRGVRGDLQKLKEILEG